MRKYYSFGTTTVAMRDNDVLVWLLQDQISSTTVTADANGNFLAETRYSAFGEIRYTNGEAVTDKLYTGQQQETELGLDYYIARWYDPLIAHFVQPDSIIPEAGSSKGYDRYSYVSNNPINYADPTGHMMTKGCEYESCNSDINSNKTIHTVLVGRASGYPPLAFSTYSDKAEASGVSEGNYNDPKGNRAAAADLALGAAGVALDAGEAAYTALSNYDSSIAIFANYYEDENSNVNVESLDILNGTNRILAFTNISIYTSNNLCSGVASCVSGAHSGYSIKSGPAIESNAVILNRTIFNVVDKLPLVRPVADGGYSRIPLIPSNNPINQSNTFYSYENVTLRINLADLSTKQTWPSIYGRIK